MSEHGVDQLGPLPGFLRDRTGVVVPAGDRMWLVRDHALGRLVLADRRFSRSEAAKPHAPQLSDAQPAPESMMSMDGADHARLRRTVAGMFSTGRVAAMAPAVGRVADQHLDLLAAAGPGADLMETVAAPLPLTVLCTLLGVPLADSGQFREWVEVLFDISVSTPREKARHRLDLSRYMVGLIGRKRQQPEDDVLGALIAAHDRGEMSMAELVTMGLALLMAGYETTVGQIGLSVLALLTDSQTREAVRQRPDRLVPALEELNRLSPVAPISFPRVAVEPVTLGDVTVQPGEAVIVSLLDSNRDARTFTEPASLEPNRSGPAHLTFGHGPHRCIGAPLARLQVQVVVERLLRRFPGVRLAPAPDAVVWKEGLGTRGLARLSVTW